ncbi:hypothetical protein DFH08DRAFT_819637 [Mycena albidolilacea]|uniref:Uncharacterized protein n=1 Tax=Mycena albidolilacea TaxID=1033008 RepID=A0AAD6ZDQ8_9AGAR|nr:hypothetical protein DFH08DRAFT_819637 [Mycena albidolilacea]
MAETMCIFSFTKFSGLRASVRLQPPGPKCLLEHAEIRSNKQNLSPPARIHLGSLVALNVVAVVVPQLLLPSQQLRVPALASQTADSRACHISAQPHTATQPVADSTSATTGNTAISITNPSALYDYVLARSAIVYSCVHAEEYIDFLHHDHHVRLRRTWVTEAPSRVTRSLPRAQARVPLSRGLALFNCKRTTTGAILYCSSTSDSLGCKNYNWCSAACNMWHCPWIRTTMMVIRHLASQRPKGPVPSGGSQQTSSISEPGRKLASQSARAGAEATHTTANTDAVAKYATVLTPLSPAGGMNSRQGWQAMREECHYSFRKEISHRYGHEWLGHPLIQPPKHTDTSCGNTPLLLSTPATSLATAPHGTRANKQT